MQIFTQQKKINPEPRNIVITKQQTVTNKNDWVNQEISLNILWLPLLHLGQMGDCASKRTWIHNGLLSRSLQKFSSPFDEGYFEGSSSVYYTIPGEIKNKCGIICFENYSILHNPDANFSKVGFAVHQINHY